MANKVKIPLLPCHALNPMLEFYQAVAGEISMTDMARAVVQVHLERAADFEKMLWN